MTLTALPMLQPFVEAVAWQRGRVPMTRAQFDALEQAARMRGFYIGGLTREALIKEAHARATRAIAEGLTRDEFLEQLGEVLDQQEGLLLDPKRLELIAQNNYATAYSAGRLQQMSDPDIVAKRPYWQYPLGPSDAHTSEICRKLEGFVAKHDDPVWDHIYPPNHHNERHLQVLTLTEEQAKEAGIYEVPPEIADGFPRIDGQTILPDPGFDGRPDIAGFDDAVLRERASMELAELAAPKRAADYGLGALADVADRRALPARIGGDWHEIADVFGVSTEGGWYGTPFGGARISQEMATAAAAPDLALAARMTLDDPIEAWAVVDQDGRVEYRLLALFDELGLVVRMRDGGWLTWEAVSDGGWDALEALRIGRLITSGVGRS